jgi:hypothetical protein
MRCCNYFLLILKNKFKLTAIDNQNGSSSDNIIVTVNSQVPVKTVLNTIILYTDGTYIIE